MKLDKLKARQELLGYTMSISLDEYEQASGKGFIVDLPNKGAYGNKFINLIKYNYDDEIGLHKEDDLGLNMN
jgi:hypothetical protein